MASTEMERDGVVYSYSEIAKKSIPPRNKHHVFAHDRETLEHQTTFQPSSLCSSSPLRRGSFTATDDAVDTPDGIYYLYPCLWYEQATGIAQRLL